MYRSRRRNGEAGLVPRPVRENAGYDVCFAAFCPFRGGRVGGTLWGSSAIRRSRWRRARPARLGLSVRCRCGQRSAFRSRSWRRAWPRTSTLREVRSAGRAVPLAFLLASVGVLLVAYGFVRLCQYFHHSGSVYAFVGATLARAPGSSRAGGCSAPTPSTAWSRPPRRASSARRSCRRSACGRTRRAGRRSSWWRSPWRWHWRSRSPRPRRGTTHPAQRRGRDRRADLRRQRRRACPPAGRVGAGRPHLHASVFAVPPGTPVHEVFLGVAFGFLSFAGFEAAATLGEEAPPDPGHSPYHPRYRDLRRAVLRDRHRGRGDGLRRGPGGRQGVH